MRTHTNKNLEEKVATLEGRVSSLQQTNSRLVDELLELKNHYAKLVDGVNERFQTVIESINSEFEIVRDKVQDLKK